MKKSGLHLDTAERIKDTMIYRVKRFMGSVIEDHRTLNWAVRRMRVQVYDQAEFIKLPKWAQMAVKHYFKAMLDMIGMYATEEKVGVTLWRHSKRVFFERPVQAVAQQPGIALLQ